MVAVSGGSPPIPLARLLAIAYRQLIDELHARLESAGYTGVRPSHGYVLLAIREQPAMAADLALLLGVTKQATSKIIDDMERDGLIKRRAHGDDARAKAIAITSRGKRFLASVEAIYEEIEAEWAQVTSRKRVEAIRDDLRAIVESAHGGRLPAVRPTR